MFFFFFTHHCIWERMWNFCTNCMLWSMISIVSNTTFSLDPTLLQVEMVYENMEMNGWNVQTALQQPPSPKKKKNWKMTLPYIFLLSVLLAQTFYTLSFHLLITQNHILTHCTSIMQHHFRHCLNKSLAQSISSPTCKRIV